jgi:hypothetical protein
MIAVQRRAYPYKFENLCLMDWLSLALRSTGSSRKTKSDINDDDDDEDDNDDDNN